MATTRTRYKSPSPSSAATSTLSLDSAPQSPLSFPLKTLPDAPPTQRSSDLTLRVHHSASAVLPSIIAGRVLGATPNSSFGRPRTHVRTLSQQSDAERQRSVSIQSLISSPAEQTVFEGAGKKRKGSDDDSIDSCTAAVSAGISMEDPDVRDAVEALGGLKADFAPTAASSTTGSPPAHAVDAPEPLLNLLQSSAHPLLSTAISLSSSTYAASKSYSPSFRYVAESAETLSSPAVSLASTLGRRTGIESVIRRRLSSDQTPQKRRKAEKEADSTQIVAVHSSARERGWAGRVMYSSTGLATALSDESRKSLKYCLRILSSANASLVAVVETLTAIVAELESYLRGSGPAAPQITDSVEDRRRRLAETVEKLKDEALTTLKTVVNTISQYAGGALPENARNIVKRQVLSFPLRWQAAAVSTTGEPTSPKTTTASTASAADDEGKAMRVLAMAREGLDMMRGVAEVVQATLESADEWCGVIGKRRESEMSAGKRGLVEIRHGSSGKRVSWVDRDGPMEGLEESAVGEVRRGTIV